MAYDNLSMGSAGVSRFSGNRGRTSDGMGRGGVRYPSPFFDMGHTYLPPTQKALLKWCRYYYLTNPLINTVIHKMSEYPITEIVIDETNPKVKEKWEMLLGQHLRFRAFQIEVGLDYYTYGMCVVTIHFPFTKYLGCRNCKWEDKAKNIHYKWRNLDYHIECPKCGYYGPAKVKDFYERDQRRIRLMRWNPEYINVDPGFAGTDPLYTFEVPLQTKNDILIGKKTVLDQIPDIFIEAIKRGKFIRFSDENVFVFKRPIISQKDEGWGMPLILPVLKDTFYLQILRKAQEAIAAEHIVPLRVLFPQAGSQSSDPYTTINLDSWKSRIESEIAKWKYDNNYIPILPLPIGNESIGGDGRALMLHQEMQVWADQIVAGMGVPREFVFGGLQYSGSNVSMRMLENMFIGYRTDHENMLNNFVIKRIAHFMGWPVIAAHMRRFKMADDLQRAGLLFQANQAQKISDQTLLQEIDQDPIVEKQRMERELTDQLDRQRKMQTAQAEVQGEVMLITAKAQAEAAKLLPQPPESGPGGAAPGAAAPGMDPMAGGMPGQPGADGKGGQQGAMVDGQQVDPAMPAGSTVDPNAGPPQEGIPPEAQSPLTMGMQGGGANLIYLARRAVNQLEEMEQTGGPGAKMGELNRMKATNPQLYGLVIQMMNDSKGSQADPLNPLQSPLPQQRPERKASPVGV